MKIHDDLRRQGLVRPRNGRIIAGVCAGLADRFNMNPWIMRVLFVAVMILLPGSQILIYPLLWFLLPDGSVPTGYGSPGGPTDPR
ncbi:PspC domain-containing protein [Arsenicicoccus piscis]|uniref:Phage shock protein PspC N-terminal domain-containing protein n=1 Tax=Arsenicicoccus piscis TaxID=673954 RepID=A0ABQ6HTQ5_9MICO|nr:PspC domain-containing protein [Arsenicicoccus piscis]GMA21864.1 hypothetical protein GCM10025862_38850 [Arsenicicoccus piscis]